MNLYLWIKTFHIVFVVTWFAGLFYLPRLFVYHSLTDDQISNDRFKVMERKLFYGITTPSAVLTLFSGFFLYLKLGLPTALWLVYKLILVMILVFYHVSCWHCLNRFKNDQNTRTHVFYRWFNEAPVVLLIAIVAIAIFKPL